MKKIMLLLTVFLFSIFMTSCGTSSASSAQSGTGLGYFSTTFQNGAFPYPGYAGCVDTFISSASPSLNFYNTGSLLAGQSSTSRTRTLIKFDLSAIAPDTAIVTAAYLSFGNAFCMDSIQSIAAYKVTHYWDTAVTWSTYNGSSAWPAFGGVYDAEAVSDVVAISATSLEVVLQLDAELVTSWLTDSLTNYGVVIIGQNEDTTTYGTYNNYSSSYSGIDARPKLTVYYSLPTE